MPPTMGAGFTIAGIALAAEPAAHSGPQPAKREYRALTSEQSRRAWDSASRHHPASCPAVRRSAITNAAALVHPVPELLDIAAVAEVEL